MCSDSHCCSQATVGTIFYLAMNGMSLARPKMMKEHNKVIMAKFGGLGVIRASFRGGIIEFSRESHW